MIAKTECEDCENCEEWGECGECEECEECEECGECEPLVNIMNHGVGSRQVVLGRRNFRGFE